VSFHIVSAVFKHSCATHDCRLTMLALAEFASDDGIAWPAQETIAERARVSARTVRRCIRSIEELGELEVRQVQSGQRRFNVYRIVLPGVAEPDYERLERQGFTLSAPFATTGQSGRPSEDDDRTNATATTGQMRPSGDGSLSVVKSHLNHHVVDGEDDEVEIIDPDDIEIADEAGLDELLDGIGGVAPSQRERFAAAYAEHPDGFARCVADARRHGTKPAALLDTMVGAGQHHPDTRPNRPLTAEQVANFVWEPGQ
jgi:hypothetical protein